MKNAEQQLLDELRELQSKLTVARQRKPWRCPECKKTTQVRLIDLVVIKYYVSPYSCSGGDYWTEGSHPEYNVHCSKCDKNIRLYHSKYGDEGDIVQKAWEITNEYRSYFKSQESVQRE